MTDSENAFQRSFKKLKDAFLEKPETPAERKHHLHDMAMALCVAVKKVFFEKSKTKFSQDPGVTKKSIVAFSGRLRIDAMEKFNQTTILSVVHYYKNATELEARKAPVCLLIMYVDRKFVPEMLRLLQYPYIDFEDDRDVLDGAGAVINLIAGYFKKELNAMGYKDLEMSPFQSFINNVSQGIEYPKVQTDRYELSFNVEGTKRLVVEMVMAPLAK